MTMPLIIPENLQAIAPILKRFFSPLLLWFSDFIYEPLISRQPNHLLGQLPQLLDFTPLEAACAAYHSGNGTGRPVAYAQLWTQLGEVALFG